MTKPPFELDAEEKVTLLLHQLNKLTQHHADNCELYQRYLNAWHSKVGSAESLVEIPYLPARAFKELSLKSVDDSSIAKTVMSSGTSGLQSRIYLDGRTSIKQSRALSEILKSYLGAKKLPLLIFDAPSMGKKASSFSARSAGSLGFSTFASHTSFALDENLQLDLAAVDQFLAGYGDAEFMIFGFTFLIWQSLVLNKAPDLIKRSMARGRLFHGGGWKKLVSLGISDEVFKAELMARTQLEKIHNYYGMAEQTGSVFIECEYGKMHASKYSEVLIRDQHTLEPMPLGERGVIQVFSTLPESYPGHSILTEDFGWVEPDVLCKCGRHGTAIHIEGRLERAEIRGCSDVY